MVSKLIPKINHNINIVTFLVVVIVTYDYATSLNIPRYRPAFTLQVPFAGLFRNSLSSPFSDAVPIERRDYQIDGQGNYRYGYETANHIKAQESGYLKRPDAIEAQGSYSYQSPDGQIISLSYVADENGFQPVGKHIPTAPPIPESILKSLAYNAAAEARGKFDDGQYHSSDKGRKETEHHYPPSVWNQFLPPFGQNELFRH